MTSRKTKHARALAKREHDLAIEQAAGTIALKSSREERRRQELAAWQELHDEKHSWQKRIKECPHCKIELDLIEANRRRQNKTSKESITHA